MNLVITDQVASHLHFMLMILAAFTAFLGAYVLSFYISDFLREREYRLRQEEEKKEQLAYHQRLHDFFAAGGHRKMLNR